MIGYLRGSVGHVYLMTLLNLGLKALKYPLINKQNLYTWHLLI